MAWAKKTLDRTKLKAKTTTKRKSPKKAATRRRGYKREFLAARRLGETIHLRLALSVPSKKNQWENAGTHVFLPADVKSMIDSLEFLLKGLWRGRSAPLVHPDIRVKFGVSNLLLDRTNVLQTLEDALVRAGILEDDSFSCCNGHLHLDPGEFVLEGQEYCEIWIG